MERFLTAQPLTLPNKQTCQKNCSHNEQRLVCIMARRGGSWGGRRLLFCSFIASLWMEFDGWFLSCSRLSTILGIIWKTQGQLYWLKLELAKSQNLENCQQSILEKPLNIVFEKVLETRVNAVKNQSVGAPVIYNLKKNWCVARRKIAKISWNWPHRPS